MSAMSLRFFTGFLWLPGFLVLMASPMSRACWILEFVESPCVLESRVTDQQTGLTRHYRTEIKGTTAGDNSWSLRASCVAQDADGQWRFSVDLTPGAKSWVGSLIVNGQVFGDLEVYLVQETKFTVNLRRSGAVVFSHNGVLEEPGRVRSSGVHIENSRLLHTFSGVLSLMP